MLDNSYLTKEEKEFIKSNAATLSVKEIAEQLKREETRVRRFYERLPKKYRRAAIKSEDGVLEDAHYWPRIQNLLFKHEIRPFKQQWDAYTKQFGAVSEIQATDENMIIDLILFDVFSNRALIAKKEAIEQIEDLKQQIKKEMSLEPDLRDRDLLSRLREQINSFQGTLSDLTQEHLDYQKKKDEKLKDLKATREQRFRQMEESKRDFFELLKELDIEKNRIREGKFAEKLRLAAKKVTEDLQASHKYEDGQYDSPFLVAEEETNE